MMKEPWKSAEHIKRNGGQKTKKEYRSIISAFGSKKQRDSRKKAKRKSRPEVLTHSEAAKAKIKHARIG